MGAVGDKRFDALKTDPRFARFPHKRSRVTIDDRFKGALKVSESTTIVTELLAPSGAARLALWFTCPESSGGMAAVCPKRYASRSQQAQCRTSR
jgi:hypothetical protein